MTDTYTLTVEGRDIDLELTTPGYVERTFMALRLPPALENPDAMTMEETMEVGELLISYTTDLPPAIYENLPADAFADLAEACGEFLEAEITDTENNLEETQEPVATSFEWTAEPRFLRDEDYPDDDLWTPWQNLTDVAGVSEAKAEALYEAGYETVGDLIEAEQMALAQVERIGNATAARIKADVGGTDYTAKGD